MAAAPASPPRLLTPGEFEALEDAVAYELLDGELVERDVSRRSSRIGAELLITLGIFVRAHGLGSVWGPDIGLQIFPGRPRRIPRADVVFVRAERLDDEREPDTPFLRIPPDLVVEVVSKRDNAGELQAKVEEYLSVGVPLVWVVYPVTKQVHVRRLDGRSVILGVGDVLSGEEVLPAFEVPVAELFPSSDPSK